MNVLRFKVSSELKADSVQEQFKISIKRDVKCLAAEIGSCCVWMLCKVTQVCAVNMTQ